MATWFVDEDDAGSSRPVDDTLQKVLHLVQEHETALRVIERDVGDVTESLPDEYHEAVSVNLSPSERVLALELINTGKEEKFFKKVLAVFAYLCDEIHELHEIAESTFYPKVTMFGVPKCGVDDEAMPPPGQAEEQLGRMLPFLQELSNFVERCHNCAVNLVQQLAKLYNGQEKLFQSTFQYVHLMPVYDSLAQLLAILVTLDCAVVQNPHLAPAWTDYKRMMQFVRDKPEAYGADEASIQRFERLLVQLDQTVLRGGTFRAAIELDFEELVTEDEAETEVVNVRNNAQMLNELFHCLRSKVDRAETAIGTHAETSERRDLVGYTALYVLYRRLTPAFVEPDAKFYRRLWALQRKIPVVVLCGKLVWMLPEFVEEYARLEVKKLEPAEPALARRAFLEKLDEVFPGTVRRCHLEVLAWGVQVEGSFSASARYGGDPVAFLEARGSLLLRGLVHAHKVSTLITTLVNLHLSLGVPMQRKVLRPLCMCVELLKTLEFTMARKAAVVAESMAHVHRILSARLLKVTRPIRAKLQASSKFDDHKMDVLAAVNVIESLLYGSDSFTKSRQSVLALSLCVCLNPNIVKESEQEVRTPHTPHTPTPRTPPPPHGHGHTEFPSPRSAPLAPSSSPSASFDTPPSGLSPNLHNGRERLLFSSGSSCSPTGGRASRPPAAAASSSGTRSCSRPLWLTSLELPPRRTASSTSSRPLGTRRSCCGACSTKRTTASTWPPSKPSWCPALRTGW